jgi:hypothetical protein
MLYERRPNAGQEGSAMEGGDWLTYAAAAERLNTTPEAVRQKAIRGRWQRTIGNDKLARVRLPDGWPNGERTATKRPNKTGVRTPSEPRIDAQLIKSLEGRVDDLKQQLAATEARLAVTDASLAAERATTERAIGAFADLAERLDALANERARPWWRRLAG